MILAIWLFQEEFLHIVSISFTALVFNELLMVAFEITTWHPYMIYAEIVTMLMYMGSMFVLKTDFDLNFIVTWQFVWKTAVITLISCFPLYIIRKIRHQLAPPVYIKLESSRRWMRQNRSFNLLFLSDEFSNISFPSTHFAKDQDEVYKQINQRKVAIFTATCSQPCGLVSMGSRSIHKGSCRE